MYFIVIIIHDRVADSREAFPPRTVNMAID